MFPSPPPSVLIVTSVVNILVEFRSQFVVAVSYERSECLSEVVLDVTLFNFCSHHQFVPERFRLHVTSMSGFMHVSVLNNRIKLNTLN